MSINSSALERISFLQKICHDEGELCDGESLKDLLSFLEINDTMPIPSLVVSPSGNFKTTWKDNEYENERFSIEFLGNNKLKIMVRTSHKIFSLNL